MTLEPNRDQIEIFVNALLRHCGKDGVVSLRAFFENADKNAPPCRITDIKLTGGLPFLIEAAEDDARRAANHPKPIVFCPPVAVFAPTGHAREIDLLEGPALAVELDKNPRGALATLEGLLGFATLVVRSGGAWTNPTTGEVEDKLHAYWRLKEPARGKDLDKLKELRRLATTLVGGDPTNIPVNHPIRWAGSWHRKAAPTLCEIISTDHLDNELDLDIALAALEAVAPQAKTNGQGGPQQSATGQGALNWSDAFGKIISGEYFHPTLVPLSASFAAHAVPRVVTRHVLRALLENTQTTDPERIRRRDVELNKLADTVRSGYEKFATAAAAPTGAQLLDPWQEFVIPPFPLDVLPGAARDFVVTKSAALGTDPTALAMATLAALSGAIHHRFRAKVQRKTDWWVHPNLWVLLVGRVSSKKTPVVDAATRPAEQYQAELQREYKAELRDWKTKNRGKKADEIDEEPPDPPERYVVTDTTIEKLGEVLSRSPRGVLVKRDELAGWIGAMERYHASGKGASADRAFWLQSWNGGHYSIDRVKSGETFIENLSTSIIGGIQPAKLAEIQGLTTDGLLQRFIPVLIQAPKFAQDIDCTAAVQAYKALVFELISLPAQRLTFTDAAIDVMTELRTHIFQLGQVGDALSEGFEGFVGKLEGYAGGLALILHLVNNPKEAVHNFIGRPTVEAVRRLVMNFILPHAYEIYCLGEGESGSERIRKITSYILTCGLGRIRLTDLTSNVRDLRGKDVLEINQRVSPLVAGGWLAPIEQGPACRAWDVNRAAIDQQFAERMREEHDRKVAILQLIGDRARV
jgi:hypothetical protein